MPLLAAFFGSIFGKILDFFMKYFTRKVAMLPAVVVAITSLTAVMLVAFHGLLSAIQVATPPEVSSLFAFLPSNTASCLAAYGSAALLKWTYDWNAGFIQRTLL